MLFLCVFVLANGVMALHTLDVSDTSSTFTPVHCDDLGSPQANRQQGVNNHRCRVLMEDVHFEDLMALEMYELLVNVDEGLKNEEGVEDDPPVYREFRGLGAGDFGTQVLSREQACAGFYRMVYHYGFSTPIWIYPQDKGNPEGPSVKGADPGDVRLQEKYASSNDDIIKAQNNIQKWVTGASCAQLWHLIGAPFSNLRFVSPHEFTFKLDMRWSAVQALDSGRSPSFRAALTGFAHARCKDDELTDPGECHKYTPAAKVRDLFLNSKGRSSYVPKEEEKYNGYEAGITGFVDGSRTVPHSRVGWNHWVMQNIVGQANPFANFWAESVSSVHQPGLTTTRGRVAQIVRLVKFFCWQQFVPMPLRIKYKLLHFSNYRYEVEGEGLPANLDDDAITRCRDLVDQLELQDAIQKANKGNGFTVAPTMRKGNHMPASLCRQNAFQGDGDYSKVTQEDAGALEIVAQFDKCGVPWVGGASGSCIEQFAFAIAHQAPVSDRFILSWFSYYVLAGFHSMGEIWTVLHPFLRAVGFSNDELTMLRVPPPMDIYKPRNEVCEDIWNGPDGIGQKMSYETNHFFLEAVSTKLGEVFARCNPHNHDGCLEGYVVVPVNGGGDEEEKGPGLLEVSSRLVPGEGGRGHSWEIAKWEDFRQSLPSSPQIQGKQGSVSIQELQKIKSKVEELEEAEVQKELTQVKTAVAEAKARDANQLSVLRNKGSKYEPSSQRLQDLIKKKPCPATKK